MTSRPVSERPLARPARCLACGDEATAVAEEVESATLAERWDAESPGAGAAVVEYVSAARLPPVVVMRECASCGLQFAQQPFEAPADWYRRFERYGWRWEYDECLEVLGARRQRVLEVGCGEGVFLEAARARGHEVTGIDFNAAAAAAARGKGLDVRLTDLADAARMVGPRYDAIVLFHVLEHVSEPLHLMRTLHALASDGGVLHLSCPGPRRFTTALEPDKRAGLRDMWDYPPFHQTRWRASAIRALLGRAGWRLEECREEPFDLRGVAVFLEDRRERAAGRRLASVPWPVRSARVAQRMVRLAPRTRRLRGMSLYCRAEAV
jgi:SAM-dependent methyltransferase